MELVSNYMGDATLRHALNDLTRKTFGFDFEGWVINGYYEGDYIPYSLMEDGKIVSNVSANRMCFLQNGMKRNYIQIGTVMTDEAYRKQGLAKKLMNYVVKKYEDSCDGFYLFSDLSAVGFYQKNAFTETTQYRYSVKEEFCRKKLEREIFMPVNATDKQIKQKYLHMVRHSAANSSMEQINKFGLQMFYTSDMENVYYAKDIDCFIVAEMEKDTLLLQSIICERKVTLLEILERVDSEYHKCQLGFMPLWKDRYMCVSESYDGGDAYRLFCLGQGLKSIEQEKLYFPELSHA